MRPFRREIALSIVGLAAAAVAFSAGPLWGWRVLGGVMLAAAVWILFVAGAAYLMPGARTGYGDGKSAFAIALIMLSMGLGLVTRAGELARKTCGVLPMLECGSACTNADVLSVPSPSRSYRAIRFVRSCAAPAALSTHVSIIAMGQPLDDGAGNAFIVDGKADLALLWIGGRHLAISGAGAAPPRLQKTYLEGIRISYEDPRR